MQARARFLGLQEHQKSTQEAPSCAWNAAWRAKLGPRNALVRPKKRQVELQKRPRGSKLSPRGAQVRPSAAQKRPCKLQVEAKSVQVELKRHSCKAREKKKIELSCRRELDFHFLIRCVFGTLLGLILEVFWEPTWRPKPSKSHLKKTSKKRYPK